MTETELVAQYEKFFTRDFPDWLAANTNLFCQFCDRADELWDRGHHHQSGMLIVYTLRFHWLTKGDGTPFRMTNTLWPDLTRLYVLLHPERNRLFEFIRDGDAFMATIRRILVGVEEGVS